MVIFHAEQLSDFCLSFVCFPGGWQEKSFSMLVLHLLFHSHLITLLGIIWSAMYGLNYFTYCSMN